MEAIQLAQMMADLNDLSAAQDQTASKALVSANKMPPTASSQPQNQSQPRSVPTQSSPASPSANRRGTDRLGRSIFTPPLSRTNSATPASNPGTPRTEGGDLDVDKASTLLSLYQIRSRIKEQDNTGLNKAREKINALAAKQQAHLAEQQRQIKAQQQQPKTDQAPASARYNYPK